MWLVGAMTPLWLPDCWVLLLLECGDGVMQGCGDPGQRPQVLCSLAVLKRECLTEDLLRKLEPTADHLDQCLHTADM